MNTKSGVVAGVRVLKARGKMVTRTGGGIAGRVEGGGFGHGRVVVRLEIWGRGIITLNPWLRYRKRGWKGRRVVGRSFEWSNAGKGMKGDEEV